MAWLDRRSNPPCARLQRAPAPPRIRFSSTRTSVLVAANWISQTKSTHGRSMSKHVLCHHVRGDKPPSPNTRRIKYRPISRRCDSHRITREPCDQLIDVAADKTRMESATADDDDIVRLYYFLRRISPARERRTDETISGLTLCY
jgi:hypothetical protein